MKKIYALVGMGLFLGGSVFAQQLVNLKSGYQTVTINNDNPGEPAKSGAGAGDTVKYYDFSDPADYTISHEGESPAEAEWKLSAVDGAISGSSKQYAGEINSPSKANGYAYCSAIPLTLAAPTPYEDINTILEMTAPIDLSTVSAASLVFNQRYRAFNQDKCFVEFSIDGGTTWDFSVEVNTEAVGNGTALTGNKNMTFPSGVGGNANVKMRFRWESAALVQGNYGYGGGYGWQIDDVLIIESPAKELSISGLQVDNGGAEQFFEYAEQPLSQAHLLITRCTVSNSGGKSQDITTTITVTKDGNPFGTYSNSTPITLAANADTTFEINAFTPTEKGDYEFSFTVTGSTEDEEYDPSNNTKVDVLSITDGIWSDKECKNYNGRTTIFESARATGYADFYIAQAFQVFNTGDKAYSITTVFPDVNGRAFSLDQPIYVEFYKFNDPSAYTFQFTADDMTMVASANEYVISAEDITVVGEDPNYRTISFTSPVTLDQGIYVATIHALGGDDYVYNVPLGAVSKSDNSGSAKGDIHPQVEVDQFYSYSNVTPFIKLNLVGDGSGIAKNTVAGNVELGQNQPNPFHGTSTINYTLKEAGAVNFEVTDITGKVVQSISQGNQAAGAYKITLNSADFVGGVYFYSIDVNGAKSTKKMVITE